MSEAAFHPMYDPPHIGLSIKIDCLEPAGLTVTEGAKALGVSRQALSKLINGTAGVSPEMALRLAEAFGGTAEIWYRLQRAYDLAQAQKPEIEITQDLRGVAMGALLGDGKFSDPNQQKDQVVFAPLLP